MFLSKRSLFFQKQKRYECPYCGEEKTDVPRHIRNCHPEKEVVKKQSKQRRPTTKVCAIEQCRVKTSRMDLHLQRIHKLVKGSAEYTEKLLEAAEPEEVAPVPEVEEEVENYLEEAIQEYW